MRNVILTGLFGVVAVVSGPWVALVSNACLTVVDTTAPVVEKNETANGE